jgi:hypothetical protein
MENGEGDWEWRWERERGYSVTRLLACYDTIVMHELLLLSNAR